MHHHHSRPTPQRCAKLALTAIAAASLSACGGGHSSATTAPEGQWTTGDLHVHTVQSDDSRPTQTLDVVLGKAFKTYGLDWIAVTNHLRSSKFDNDGNALPAPVAFSYGMEKFETPRIRKLQAQNTYADKVVFSAYEWDMPARDHVGIGIFDNGAPVETSFAAVKEFQYLFTTGDESLFDPADVQKWKAKYPQRLNQTGADGIAALKWLSDNYPKNSYAVINHPSRNPGKYTAGVFRQMNDINPNIVFAIEGMVGNQLEPNRGGYTSAYTDANLPNRTYGGTDYVVAKLGGVWDSLLGEGRRIWNVADSDSHFEIDANDNSSGYFPGEYAKNYVWRPKGSTGIPGLIDDIRAGRMFGVFGDLVSALDFDIVNRSGKAAYMGQELKVAKGDTAVVEIRFKSPPVNNYQRPVASGKSGNMTPKVDHIDLIVGDVGKKFAPGTPEYESGTNPSTRVLRRFTAADWKVDDNGYYVMKVALPITKNQYFRLRGTNLGVDVPNLTANGEPLPDQPVNTTDAAQRHDQINDRNYGSIWFYSNPIFVTAE